MTVTQLKQITPEDHPGNVSVFKASSMIEAILKADAERRKPGIRIAVWHQPGPALATDMADMENLKIRATRFPEIKDHYERASRHTHTFRNRGHMMPSPGLAPDIERSRGAGSFTLRCVFSKVSVEGRCQYQASYHPHLEMPPHPLPPVKEDCLFNGQHLKIVRIHHGPGMHLFDEDDIALYKQLGEDAFLQIVPPKWQLAVGDAAFFMDDALHGPPEYIADEAQDTPRTADIIDCFGGIPLNQARKFG